MKEKEVRFLREAFKTPPFDDLARQNAGFYLGRLQCGDAPSLPWSRPMHQIGKRVAELRIGGRETTGESSIESMRKR